jgi:hypothetical protein
MLEANHREWKPIPTESAHANHTGVHAVSVQESTSQRSLALLMSDFTLNTKQARSPPCDKCTKTPISINCSTPKLKEYLFIILLLITNMYTQEETESWLKSVSNHPPVFY